MNLLAVANGAGGVKTKDSAPFLSVKKWLIAVVSTELLF